MPPPGPSWTPWRPSSSPTSLTMSPFASPAAAWEPAWLFQLEALESPDEESLAADAVGKGAFWATPPSGITEAPGVLRQLFPALDPAAAAAALALEQSSPATGFSTSPPESPAFAAGLEAAYFYAKQVLGWERVHEVRTHQWGAGANVMGLLRWPDWGLPCWVP